MEKPYPEYIVRIIKQLQTDLDFGAEIGNHNIVQVDFDDLNTLLSWLEA